VLSTGSGAAGAVNSSGVVKVGAGICSGGGTLATSGGFPGNRADVVQTPIAAIPAMMPVNAVSDNFDERFSGSRERMLAKTAVHLICSLPKKLDVVLAGGSASSFSTTPSKSLIVPRRALIL
jgi:hypothetical protein